MLLHDARRGGRLVAAGELIPLEEQDRGTWNRAEIDEGAALLETALRRRRPGGYQIQAAIAACHATAAAAADTDWAQIALLYGQLAGRSANPIVELNRAVAVPMAGGGGAGPGRAADGGAGWKPRHVAAATSTATTKPTQ